MLLITSINFNALFLVLDGSVEIEGNTISSGELVIFKQNSKAILFHATTNAKLLWMSGAPLMSLWWPFVMNSQDEILQT